MSSELKVPFMFYQITVVLNEILSYFELSYKYPQLYNLKIYKLESDYASAKSVLLIAHDI